MQYEPRPPLRAPLSLAPQVVVDARDLSSLCNYVAIMEAAMGASERREAAQLSALQARGGNALLG